MKVLYFQRCPTTISNAQITKSFKPTSIPKKLWVKISSKSSEQTLSNKSKHLY